MKGSIDMSPWRIVCFGFIIFLGLTGNLIVCLVMAMSGRRLRSVPFNVYIVSLAATDLCLAVIGIPIYMFSKSSFNHPTGLAGTVLCKIITGNLIPFWLAGSSVYVLVLISFERFYAIRDPFLARTRVTSKKTICAVLSAWIVGLMVQIPVIAGAEYSEKNATVSRYCTYKWKSKTTTFSIYLASLAVQYGVPAFLLILNFVRIQRCLGNLDGVLKRQMAGQSPIHNRAIVKQKKKTVQIVFIVVIAFFVCWTPNTVMFFVFQYGGNSSLSPKSDAFGMSVVLAFSSAWINPLLYSFQSAEFRAHCMKIFRKIYRILTVHRHF
eukprot:Seg1405.6 transcript_id=Seg1405.6/GoldUCD/mRNA.D3Y31 product="Phe13-bombesin receptor" protein_id=Seg1405.6/GoldUCD/D3Y31